jgi:polyhydroxybutyrate depolymerase
MKKTAFFSFIFIIFIELAAYSQDIGANTNPDKKTFVHNGITREYILHIPNNLLENAPLVLALHGYGSSSEKIVTYSGMNLISDIKGFAVCYPQGLLDEKGKPNWNARLTITSNDDIGFLSELAKYLQKQYGLSSKNTFVCGMSNGGFMSYTLACEKPDVFKAIGSVSGTMSGQTWRNRNISVPIPILQIHGIADKTVPIDGSMNLPGGWGGAPAMDSVIIYWTKVNNCTTKDSTFFPQNTKAYYYKNGTRGNQVWYYKIENWGHVWPGAPSKDPNKINTTGTKASEVIWEFFSNFIQ